MFQRRKDGEGDDRLDGADMIWPPQKERPMAVITQSVAAVVSPLARAQDVHRSVGALAGGKQEVCLDHRYAGSQADQYCGAQPGGMTTLLLVCTLRAQLDDELNGCGFQPALLLEVARLSISFPEAYGVKRDVVRS